MKKSNYTKKQVAFALKQAELDIPISEVRREIRVCGATVLTL